MATVTKPMALDESFNTTENTSRNVADVLAEGLDNIAESISPRAATEIPIESGSATNTKDYIDSKVSTINAALSGKMDKIPTGEHTVYGSWTDSYYGTARLWVSFPNADDYTISITSAKYRSGDTTMTAITGATIAVKNDCGFLVSGDISAVNHYGEIKFTTA